MNVRFGLMIIGETLTGKSTIIRSLKGAMRQIRANGYTGDDYLSVDSETLNPKSITMDELYGSFSVLTQEWTDGLASTLIRNFVNK
jgi:dynein heavy chain